LIYPLALSLHLQLLGFSSGETSKEFLSESVVSGTTFALALVLPSLDGLKGS